MTKDSESKTQPTSNQTSNRKLIFDNWSTSWLVRKVIFEKKLPAFWVGAAIFFVYWIVPLISSFIAGTALPGYKLQQWSESLSTNLPDLLSVVADYLSELSKCQTLSSEGALNYLNDQTHLFFAIVISVGAGIAAHVVRNIHLVAMRLHNEGIIMANDEDVLAEYNKYHKLATHKMFRFMSFVMAVIVFIIFVAIAALASNNDWWGYYKHGASGYLFVFIEAFMVYWGSRTIILMGIGSMMLARIVRFPMVLRPFHPDGCNGLSSLGRQIIYLWLFALSLALAIYITLSLGYLDIEKTLVVWIIAILGTLSIPSLAVLPLMSALRSIQSAQRKRLAHYESSLNELLDNAESFVRNNQPDKAVGTIEKSNKIQEARKVITSANVWPFNPRALIGVIIVYIIQMLLTLNELMGLFE